MKEDFEFFFPALCVAFCIFFALLFLCESMQAAALGVVAFFVISGCSYLLCDHRRYEQEQQKRAIAEEEAKRRFLQHVSTLRDAYERTPAEFEQLVGILFERQGFDVQKTQSTRDEGIDLYLFKDDETQLVQCKRYKDNISAQVVREFFGVMVDKRVRRGYIVTTGHFTGPARSFAADKGIHLIDGPELAEMLEDINMQQRNKDIE